MKGIEPRFYRKRMGEGRFRSFVVGYKDSDLWIGIDEKSFDASMPAFAQQKLQEIRQELEGYILKHPDFATSFVPVDVHCNAPESAKKMGEAGKMANTGPMAAVAGIFSELMGQVLIENFPLDEIVVENGGDIFLQLKHDLVLTIYAGDSPLSNKLGIHIPAKKTPLGVCTSAGTVGPSTSFGKADAVVVISQKTAVADAFATAIGNNIHTEADIIHQLQVYETYSELQSLLIICDGKMGIKGDFELRLLNNDKA